MNRVILLLLLLCIPAVWAEEASKCGPALTPSMYPGIENSSSYREAEIMVSLCKLTEMVVANKGLSDAMNEAIITNLHGNTQILSKRINELESRIEKLEAQQEASNK
ncbi:MAG TPA: hypothetical protein V6C52_08240 [Coleofasciculaceae cyanobacterium]